LNDTVPIRTDIPPIDLDAMTNPDDYVMEDNDLRVAANAALTLGKPLLLTGEAGVGKSQFANWLASQLELQTYLKFVVKSTTEAQDLFYQYDALARFHWAQIARAFAGGPDADQTSDEDASAIDPLRYITYNALGEAILHSIGRKSALEQGLVSSVMPEAFLNSIPLESSRAVVLIDEIDKAPRDVPNDILDEIDSLSFTVRELDNKLAKADKRWRPVVVITNNSERDLPKPFLRRCIFYQMRFPSEAVLARIVDNRVGRRYEVGESLRSQGIRFFRYLKGDAGLRQPPGLAELLDWFYTLAADGANWGPDLSTHPRLYEITKSTLLKDRHDQVECDRAWLNGALETAGRASG